MNNKIVLIWAKLRPIIPFLQHLHPYDMSSDDKNLDNRSWIVGFEMIEVWLTRLRILGIRITEVEW